MKTILVLFNITNTQGNIIMQKKTLKNLGYTINKEKNLDVQMETLMTKVKPGFRKIRGEIPFLNLKNRKIILEAKLKGQLRLTMPILLNQYQQNKKELKVC